MKLSKLLLAVAGAAIALGALVSSSGATRLSFSGTGVNATWAVVRFTGGLGTIECEVILNKSLHSRTITKVRGLLTGYITAANVIRCIRGGATILRETLPWHVQYVSFGGRLPNVEAVFANILGASIRVREPTFGIECLARSTAAEPLTLTYDRIVLGTIQQLTLGGTIQCGSTSGTVSGITNNFTSTTVTLF